MHYDSWLRVRAHDHSLSHPIVTMAFLAETPRTRLREIELTDADFICTLLNQPSFIANIGDRGVRTPAEAADFIGSRYRPSYEQHGFGLYLVEDRHTATPMGMCGLVVRPVLPGPDIGFAFLPSVEGRGYALEAATVMVHAARHRFGLHELHAIVQPSNARSLRLLGRLGFDPAGALTLPGETVPVRLLRRTLVPAPAGTTAER
jgi:[ribosomal protein S5]-alanine N-acetyltransferase